MHRQNVGMRKIAEQPRLTLEPPRDIRDLCAIAVFFIRLHDLDGDGAIPDPDLLAEVDLAHAALADFAHELAAAYLTSFQMQHRALQRFVYCSSVIFIRVSSSAVYQRSSTSPS